jgi:hypothetical protein
MWALSATDKLYVRVVFDVPNPSTCPGGQRASALRPVRSPPSGGERELHKSPVGEGSRKLEWPPPLKRRKADASETSVALKVSPRKGAHQDRGKPGSRLERHGSPPRGREREGVSRCAQRPLRGRQPDARAPGTWETSGTLRQR